LLITAKPRILAFSKEVGVASEGVFDFFKPRRSISKNALLKTNENPEWFGVLENEIAIYKEQPVFDGQYSNQCYINRICEAYQHYKEMTNQNGIIFENWENIIMHLPYCFQARRTFVEIYSNEYKITDDLKTISKSQEYIDFVTKTIYPSEIASSEIGNMYTGSIFLGLLSTLCFHFKNKTDLTNKKFGFLAYGSGSKSKVFEAEVQENWLSVIEQIDLFETLAKSYEIDFITYEKLHKKELKTLVLSPKNEFVLAYIEKENPVLTGARYYKFIS